MAKGQKPDILHKLWIYVDNKQYQLINEPHMKEYDGIMWIRFFEIIP